MGDPHDQHGYRIRVEWGPDGVRRLAAGSAVLVIVDVLSFSTTVDIAVGRGGSILPLPWRDERAVRAAVEAGAVLGSDNPAGWSLRPSSLLDLPAGTRLALPSPNGATLARLAAEQGVAVFAGGPRNAAAVAAAAAELAGGGAISVIAAGERWPPDHAGQLRPAIEDFIGAGAVVTALVTALRELDNGGATSPEALTAADVFAAATDRGLAETLRNCASGRELIARGHGADVELAAQCEVSRTAPRLVDGEYRAH